MKRIRKPKNGRSLFAAFILFFICTMPVMAQYINVKGTVVNNATSEPVANATVTEKGTSHTTMTDIDGSFALQVDTSGTLEVRLVGYIPYTLKVKDSGPYRIELIEDNQSLEEVVVVGYGTQKKVNLTGAVSAVKVDEIMSSRTITNVSSALSGLVPGLSVQQNSGMAGNSNSKLLIRGLGTVNNADPLIVVDGMPDVDINRINMNDIESISVLKDASSSAIYGSRAANGVILITTKTGKGQGKVSLNYTGSVALSNPTKFYDVLENYAKALTMHQWAGRAGRSIPVFMDGTVDEWLSMSMIDPVRFPNTNQLDWVTRQGHVESHNVSASGGNEKHNFFLSLGYLDETGFMINNDNTRYNFRANLDYNIRKNIKVGTRLDGQWTDMNYAYANGFVDYGNANVPLSFAITGLLPYNSETDQYGGVMAYGEANNAANMYAEYTSHHNLKDRQEFNGNIYGEWKVIEGLTARIDFGLSYYSQFLKSYSSPTGMQLYNFQTEKPVQVFIPESSGIRDALNQAYKTLTQASLRYERTFGQHHISSLLGYNEEYWFNRTMGSGRDDRIHTNITEVNGALTKTQFTRGTSDEEGLRSYLGRVNYAFDERYLVELNFRVDGSSKFLPGHQYGFFP